MEVVYNWSVKKIYAKPVFTDKHGNVRENVLKKVELECVASYSGTTDKMTTNALFDLIDLTDFTPVDQLTNEQVLQWSLDVIKDKEKTEELLFQKLTKKSNRASLVEINL